MKISCNQFEGLISFYLNNELNETLKEAFEEHLKECPTCHIRYNMLNSIITDLKDSYNQIIVEENSNMNIFENISECIDNVEKDDIQLRELSAYIDNELDDDASIKMHRNIIAKPFLRKKLESLYNLRKIMNNEFDAQKNKLRNDYSKSIVRGLDANSSNRHAYLHCIAFIMFVIGIVFISTIVVMNIM